MFLVLVEESDVETTNRDLQVFSDGHACYRFLETKVQNYKDHEWAEDLRPPEVPHLYEVLSLPNNELVTIYEFEHQSVHHDFFCINIFIKKME